MIKRESFNDCFARGRIAESHIGRWLVFVKNYILLPAYDIEIPTGKGPRLLTDLEELIAPDILAMKYQKRKLILKWFEAKHKTRFTWRWTHRPPCWQTGVDLRHYLDYIKVQERTKIDVFLLFLHSGSIPSQYDLEHGAPDICPTGLYGNTLAALMAHEDHRDSFDKGGKSYPMVYWNECDLLRLATLDEVRMVPAPLWKGVFA